MDTTLTITNLLAFLFWVRLWSQPDRDLYFNPFLSAPTRLTDRILDFLHPVLPLPGRLMSLLLLVFLLVFRALALHNIFAQGPWTIAVGTIFSFAPAESGLPGALRFSALHFLFFVVRFWGVFVLLQLLTPVPRRDRATEAFHFAALPLSALRRWLQVALLVAANAILVYELSLSSTAQIPAEIRARMATLPMLADFRHAPVFVCLVAFSLTDLLMMSWQLMFALLVGAFFALVLQNPALNAVCGEGIGTLLGVTRRRLVVGMIDLTPLLYMFVVYLLYSLLCAFLLAMMAKYA